MTEKRFDYTHYDDGTESIYDREKDEYYFNTDLDKIGEILNDLHDENQALKERRHEDINDLSVIAMKYKALEEENKELKDKYERKDRQLKRTKKDIEKYTDYFMNEMNWDCDRIMKEVFRW